MRSTEAQLKSSTVDSRIGRQQSPVCPYCGSEDEMTQHLLLCWPSHAQARSSTNYINSTDPRRMWFFLSRSGPWHVLPLPTGNERESWQPCLSTQSDIVISWSSHVSGTLQSWHSRQRSQMERPTGQCHLSTILAHLQKTTKTASVVAFISWPLSYKLATSLCGPCGSCLLLRPP